MAFNKTCTFKYDKEIKALNVPKDWDIFNLSKQIKIASKREMEEEINNFSLKEAINKYPDHLFVKIFAIKKDEPNDNGDAFSEDELKKAAKTFIGVPLFTNHQNDDIEKSKGECVHAWYDNKEGGIFIIGRVDKLAYPKLARGIEQEYVKFTSMGASVSFSCCSICHARAASAKEFCQHISAGKNRKFSGETTCQYHKNPEVADDEKCPVCGSTKGENKLLKHSASQVYEHNFGLNFIENSFVVNPACHDCGIREILNIPEIQKKIGRMNEAIDKLYKAAFVKDENSEVLMKMGGITELNALKNSMNEMEYVVKSMLDQKENVSIAYVKDITEAMEKIQETIDELVEMGYAALPSSEKISSGGEGTNATTGSVPNINNESQTQQPQPAQFSTPTQVSSTENAKTFDLGGLGNMTVPGKAAKNKEDFLKYSETIINKITSLTDSINLLSKQIANDKIGDIIKMANETNEKIEKTAAAGIENTEVITEKQLEKKDEALHPRTGEIYEGITESKEQIGGNERSNDTTTVSPQVRKGTYETITEDQLSKESFIGESIIQFDNTPDVITEKQWTDFSKTIASDVSSMYNEVITEKQIAELLTAHKFVGAPEVITEAQLKNIDMQKGLQRWASKDYANNVVKMANEVISDIISRYKKSPNEIKKAIALINDDVNRKSKVAYLAILNSLPSKRNEMNNHFSNLNYFNKKSSKLDYNTIDAIVLASAHNSQFGVKAEDIFDAMGQVLNNEKAMKMVEAMASKKLNKFATELNSISMTDAVNSAINELDKPEDKLYRIKATMEDIGVPITNKVAFCNKVKKFAQEMINDESVAAAVIRIEVGDNGELIIDVEDGATSEITSDDIGEAIDGIGNGVETDTDESVDKEVGEGEEANDDFGGIMEDEENEGEEEENEVENNGENNIENNNKEEDNSAIAAKGKKTVKTAQMMGGDMGMAGGGGGTPAAPGPGLPGTPGPAAPGTQPMESLTGNEGMEGEDTEDMGDTKEPLPPGSLCPVCGSEDVDIVGGKGKCNSCSSEMTFKIDINVTKWKGLTKKEEEGEEEGGFEGEGFEVGEETAGAGADVDAGMAGAGAGAPPPPAAPAGLPAAASVNNKKINKFASVVKIKPEAIKKIAERKITLGSISPINGQHNTISLGNGDYVSLEDGRKYKVSFAISKDGKDVYAQWEWDPNYEKFACPSCDRARKNFVKALKSLKMNEASFDELPLKDKVDTIVKLKQAGKLSTIKTASKNSSIMEEYKTAFTISADKFPVESCIEKLARRFGEKAVCLSGPDEGKNLAESVCNRLKGAGFYTDKIAMVVADRWNDCDGDEECVTHQVRSGYTLRQASEICSALKTAIAEDEDMMLDDMSNNLPEETSVGGIEESIPADTEIDPFAGDGLENGEATVTLELPMSVIEQLDKKLDEALGENTQEEEHHQEVPTGTGEVEIPIDEAKNMDEKLDKTLGEEGEDEAHHDEEGGEVPGTESPIGEEIAPEEGAITETGKADEFNECGAGGGAKPCTVFEGDLMEGKGNESKVILNGEPLNKKDEFNNTQASNNFEYKEAKRMNGSIGGVGKSGMDLSKLIDVLNKQADAITQENVQDSKDIGTYSAGEKGSEMGHENETIPTAGKPSVPRDKALMGKEDANLNPQDKPQPEIPSADATMGHEKEVGLSGGDTRYTGGDKGQGKTNTASAKETQDEIDESLAHMRGFGSSKKGLSNLAEVIANKLKLAEQKKLEPKKPVSEDSDINPIKGGDGSVIGKEEKFKAEEVTDKEAGQTEDGFIGHEKETFKTKPTTPGDQPEVFTGESKMGEEELDSEKTTRDKGTVIANSNIESEAFRVAARMLDAKIIAGSELQGKVNELKSYKVEQIKDFEKSIFASKKGLETVSDGLSQTVQIKEASAKTENSLKDQLTSMFSLEKRNVMADGDETIQLRKTFNQ